jgi:hypothetical protein
VAHLFPPLGYVEVTAYAKRSPAGQRLDGELHGGGGVGKSVDGKRQGMPKLIIFAIISAAAVVAALSFSFAQSPAPPGGPAPAQAGEDPSMAPPTLSKPSVHPAEKPGNPESTVGLAPSDQPVNNAKQNVAGQFMPSPEETAKYMPSIFEHDRQPTITHTFNFTKDQKRLIVEALANDKGDKLPKEGIFESAVLPASTQLKPVPEVLVTQMPWLRNYDYTRDATRIIFVDPYLRFVAAVIE